MVSWTSVWSVWGSAAFPFCIIVIICCKKSLLVCSMWWGSAVLLGTCVIWYYAMSCSIFICINWPNQYPDTNCEYKTICLSTVPLAMRKERHKNVQFIPGMFNVCWFFFFFGCLFFSLFSTNMFFLLGGQNIIVLFRIMLFLPLIGMNLIVWSYSIIAPKNNLRIGLTGFSIKISKGLSLGSQKKKKGLSLR